MEYKVPNQFYFRIHHVRPRFKNDVENVLIFVAESIAKLSPMSEADFAKKLNQAIYGYPGNANKELKTINNWRTEISSLFGFVQHNAGEIAEPGRRAKELAQDGDLVAFFKTFLYSFQYPGAHIKSHAIQEQIEHGIHFKPAQYLLRLLTYIKKVEGANIGLTKGEICHCIFNDLRVTRDGQDVSLVWERIRENRKNTTTVLVAQRISSLRHADLIFMLQDGKVIGMGNHEQMCLYSLEPYCDSTMQRMWKMNGGKMTYGEMTTMRSKAEVREILNFIENLPDYLEISLGDRDFYLVHGLPAGGNHPFCGKPLHGGQGQRRLI